MYSVFFLFHPALTFVMLLDTQANTVHDKAREYSDNNRGFRKTIVASHRISDYQLTKQSFLRVSAANSLFSAGQVALLQWQRYPLQYGARQTIRMIASENPSLFTISAPARACSIPFFLDPPISCGSPHSRTSSQSTPIFMRWAMDSSLRN